MKPEQDPVVCVCDCGRDAVVSTPEGGMCREHAKRFYADLTEPTGDEDTNPDY